MAALGDNLNRLYDVTPLSETRSYVVKSGSTVYEGSFVGIEAATGYVIPWVNAATGVHNFFLGIATSKVVGDGVLKVQVIKRSILKQVAVTGITTIAGVGKPIYLIDDGTGITSVAPAANGINGRVLSFFSSTIFDVLIYSDAEYAASAGI